MDGDGNFGAFGRAFDDQYQPVTDQFNNLINQIQSQGVHGQIARLQAQDDAIGAGDEPDNVAIASPTGANQPDGSWYKPLLPTTVNAQDRNAGNIFAPPPSSNAIFSDPLRILPGDPQISDANSSKDGGSNIGGASRLSGAGNIFHDVTSYLTSPEFTDVLRQQGLYINKAGDIVGLGGTGLAVAGTVTGQPEIGLPGLAGMAVGRALNRLGNGAIVLSDVLANNRNAAVKDAVGAGVSNVLPPTIDPQPLINHTAKYYGY